MDAEEIVGQCSQDWQRVKGIQAELQSATSKPISSEQPLLQVLEETEKRYHAVVTIIFVCLHPHIRSMKSKFDEIETSQLYEVIKKTSNFYTACPRDFLGQGSLLQLLYIYLQFFL